MNIFDRLTARVRIDWTSFARTRGGFFDWLGPVAPSRTGPSVPLPAGSLTAPGGFVPTSPIRWEDWREWHPVYDHRIADMLPVFSAPRGGITYAKPVPVEERLKRLEARR